MSLNAIEKAKLARGRIHSRIWFYIGLPSVGARCGPNDFHGSDSLRRQLHNYVHFYGGQPYKGVLLAEVL